MTEFTEATSDLGRARAAYAGSGNLTDEIELRKAHVGEILVATQLGVSTKAGITA